MAQSSVTLYGVADAGIGKIEAGSGLANPANDASDKTEFISGSTMNNGTSRLGVRGVEDLGGGLKAGFQFETGLDLDDGGNSGAFWSRQANIWLGGNWGTVKLGRQFTPSYLTTSTFELTGTANYSVLANTYNYAGIGSRANSAFAYVTPSFGGFTGAGERVELLDFNDVEGVAATGAPGRAVIGIDDREMAPGRPVGGRVIRVVGRRGENLEHPLLTIDDIAVDDDAAFAPSDLRAPAQQRVIGNRVGKQDLVGRIHEPFCRGCLTGA